MKRALLALSLVALVVLVYGRIGANGFVNFDDDTYVTKNRHVLAGPTADGMRWALTSATGSNWHPLTWLSHMVNAGLYGTNPAGHHWTSVLLHAANAALLFAVLLALTGRDGRSWLVAALFALHPLHVESVAWIAERKDMLAGTFWLLTMLAYGRYARRPRAGRYLAVLAAFAAGLLAKPMLVTLPFVLLLLDVWPLARWRTLGAGKLVLEKLPLLALTALSSYVTYVVQTMGGAMRPMEAISVGARLVNAVLSYVIYLRKALLPYDLAILYPHPFLTKPQMPVTAVTLGVLAGTTLLAVTVVSWRQRASQPWLVVGWLWYLGTLVPVIGLVQVGEQALADRYTYLPLIGIYLATTWSVAEWIEAKPRIRSAALVLTSCFLLVLGLLTVRQVALWRSSETLFRRSLAVAPSATAYNNLALALEGRGAKADASRSYEAALALRPDFAPALNNFAALQFREGRVTEAEAKLREALRLRPRYIEALVNLGSVLQAQGRLEEAQESFERALGTREVPEALAGLGTVHARQGDLRSAENLLREALRQDPTRAEWRKNLGIVLLSGGKPDEALREYDAALVLRPDDPDLLADSGALLARVGRTREGIARLERALVLRPDHAGARAALADLRGQAPQQQP